MNLKKSLKLLSFLLAILIGPYGFFWMQASQQITQQIADFIDTEVHPLTDGLGYNLTIQKISVSGFPLKLNVIIDGITLNSQQTADPTLIEVSGPIQLSSQVFGFNYQLLLPKKITLENPEAEIRYTLELREMSQAQLSLDIRPIDIWFAQMTKHPLPTLDRQHVSKAKIHVAEGNILLSKESNEPTLLLKWGIQDLSFQQQTIPQKLNRLMLSVNAGGFSLEPAGFEWVMNFKPEWRDYLDTLQNSASHYNGIVLSVDMTAETQLLTKILGVTLKNQLSNGEWSILAEGAWKENAQKDPLPIGTTTLSVTQLPLILGALKDLYPLVIDHYPTLSNTPGFGDDHAFALFMDWLPSTAQAAPEQPNETLFTIERALNNDFLINGKTLATWSQELTQKITPAPIPTNAKTPSEAPKPTAAELDAERRRRIQKWIVDHEKNIEFRLKTTESLDALHLKEIEAKELAEKNKEQSDMDLKKAEQQLKNVELFQKLHKQKGYAEPNS